MSFLNILLLFLFCKAWLKISLPDSQSTQKFRKIKACFDVKTRRKENVKFIVTNYVDRVKL